MTCNNNSGLLTELVLKVRMLAIEVNKLWEDSNLLHDKDSEIDANIESLQNQINEIIKEIEIKSGDLASEEYKSLLENVSSLKEYVDTNIFFSDNSLEYDAGKYLYNDGEKLLWKEVEKTDLQPIYDLIYSLHPTTLGFTLTPTTKSFDLGQQVKTTFKWTATNELITGDFKQDVKKDSKQSIEGGTSGSFECDYGVIKSKQDITAKIEGVTVGLDGKEQTGSQTATINILPFVYVIKLEEGNALNDGVNLSTLKNNIVVNTAPTTTLSCKAGSDNKKYQYYVLTQSDIKKVSFNFSLADVVTDSTLLSCKNYYDVDSQYKVFKATNLTEGNIAFTITLSK